MKAILIAATLFAALPLCAWSQSSRLKDLPPPVELPANLSQAEIAKGMSRIKPKIDACAAKSQHQGTVTVSVKVAGNGAVDDVKVKSSPDGALGACVARAVQTAAFGRTQKGGTFSYPFRF
jgi:TonB family protein